tara:strand:+ start:2598 stop:3497 length:900 start_codon:yes stop_codon:yes gene_type:complete
LLFASIFWLLNALSKDLTLDIQYPCIYEHSSDDLVITNNPPKQLKIFARGSGFNLIGQAIFLKRNPLYISLVDLEIDRKGNAIVATSDLLDEISNQLGSNISVESIYPSELKVRLEKKVSKIVPVTVKTDFTFSPQTRLKDLLIPTPQKIKVKGPKSILDSITEVHTVLINRKVEGNVAINNINLIVPFESKLVELEPSQISLNIEVEQFTESTLVLPINVINLPEGINLRMLPSQATIKFLVPLRLYDVITASNFKATVDYKEIKKEKSRLKIKVVQTKEMVEIISIEPERAEFLIKK